MLLQDKGLQGARTQDQCFQRIQPQQFQPAQRRRPAAEPGAGLFSLWQLCPMLGWPQVMFDVIAIIEEQQVVEAAIVTDRAANVFVMALKLAQAEAQAEARQICGEKETGRTPHKECP